MSSTVNPLITKRSKVKTEAEAMLPISPSSQVNRINTDERLEKYILIFTKC